MRRSEAMGDWAGEDAFAGGIRTSTRASADGSADASEPEGAIMTRPTNIGARGRRVPGVRSARAIARSTRPGSDKPARLSPRSARS